MLSLSESAQGKKTLKIDTLDGVRSIAIILVLLRHSLYMFKTYDPTSPFAQWIDAYGTFFLNGWIGVDLFFVLSGFLIARPFIQNKSITIKKYAMKRILRIVPAYYFILILCVIGFFPGFGPAVEGPALGWSILYHLLFFQDYFPSNINIVFWSLGVEEKFYLIAPLIVGFLIITYNRRPLLCAGAIVVIILTGLLLRALSYVPDAQYSVFFTQTRSPFHCCWDPLFIGVAIAFFEKYRSARNLNLRKLPVFIFYISATALCLLMLSHQFLKEITIYDASLQPLVIAIIMGGLVWSATTGGAPELLKSSPLRFISKISYSLYLVHLPLWPLSFYITSAVMLAQIPPYLFILAFTAIFLSLSTAFATSVYYLVERPFLNLKDRIEYD